ncbi:MAG: transketolase [Bdellovibrionaceae bacterium]|nr:transketolase [Pseudobdellovibrionaceae bacterium]
MELNPSKIRLEILNMAYRGRSVHIPSAFSIVEIVCVLFNQYIEVNEKNSDLFVLSKGHGAMSLYVVLVLKGVLPKEYLINYFQDGSLLHGLSEYHVPGIEVSGGSLGHGLPIATGMAYGLKKIKKSNKKVFCLIGDGELNEGSNWESILFANHHQLDNLILILDFNKYQAMGRIEDVLKLEPLEQKFKSFGFDCSKCNGHDLKSLEETLTALVKNTNSKPKVLIADTVKGKGLTFMENNNTWHYTVLDEKTFEEALNEVGRNA